MITATEKKTASRLRSMTGFAQTVLQEDGFVLTVTLRSVNHRSLDLHLHLPEPLQRLEGAVRKEIALFQPRGHLQLRVTLERGAGAAPAVDENLIEQYLGLFRRIAERHGLSLETAMQALPQLPGVVTGGGPASSQPISAEMEAAFLNTVRSTLRSWDDTRASEGAILESDLRDRALRITTSLEDIEQLRRQSLPAAQAKLRERLQAWLGQDALDSTRLAQEAAVLAEHTDVSEEILRLRAHLTQFLAMLESGSGAGKKLEFLLQEIQRELNTLLAKTAGMGESGLPMTQAALEMKGEAEKLREQVQNVQ